MTKKSKLEQLGLMEKARQLRDDGYGWHEIAAVLKQIEPKFDGSHMSVKRGLQAYDRLQIREQVKQGLNPVDEMNREFREKMDKNTHELECLKVRANTILNEAMDSDSISDKTKALKEVRDTLAQMAKNNLALQQFYQMKIDTIQKESFHQREQITKLLLMFISKVDDVVCPMCKEKAIPAIMKIVESEGED